MSTAHVLVVDSDRERAAAVAERARNKSWTVSVVTSAPAARDAIDERPLALALIDSTVWHEGGLGLVLAASHPTLPVIVMTGGDERADRLVEQLQLGAMTYIPRTADSRQIVETIQSIIDLTRRNPYRERIREFLTSGQVELHLASDPTLIPLVVGYVQRVLEDYGLTIEKERSRVGLALTEAISNAMIHGNMEVPSVSRTSDSSVYYDAIDARRVQPPFKDRAVHFVMRFSQSSVTFVIRDQGKGFDPRSIADPTAPENLHLPSGRGILLMRAYCDTVSWNDAGTEVTMMKVLTAPTRPG